MRRMGWPNSTVTAMAPGGHLRTGLIGQSSALPVTWFALWGTSVIDAGRRGPEERRWGRMLSLASEHAP